MKERSLFFREPGFVVTANLCAGLLSTVVHDMGLATGSTWLVLGVAVFCALTVLNVIAARCFDPQWTRQSVGLLVIYECVAAGAGLWWALRGL